MNHTFEFGEEVSLDGLRVYVIGFWYRRDGLQVQIHWVNNGLVYDSWVDDWRLIKT